MNKTKMKMFFVNSTKIFAMFIILINIFTISVEGSSYTWMYGIPATDSFRGIDGEYVYFLPQLRTLQHSSGKFFYTYASAGSTPNFVNIQLYTIYSDGSTPSHMTLTTAAPRSDYIDTLTYSIHEVNSTHIVIYVQQYWYTNSVHTDKIELFFVNIINYNTVTYSYNVYSSTTTIYRWFQKAGQMFIYDNVLYFVGASIKNMSPNLNWCYLAITCFNLATKTVTYYSTTMWTGAGGVQSNQFGFPFGFQYSASQDKAYVTVSCLPDSTLPLLYEIDLDGHIFTLLATCPDNARYNRTSSTRFLGNGIITNGDYKYMWFSWSFSKLQSAPSGVVLQYYVNWKVVFNQTISADKVIGNQDKCGIIETGYVESLPTYSLGYMDNASIATIYYPEWDEEISKDTIDKVVYTISDWFNYAGGTLTPEITHNVDDIPSHIQEWTSNKLGNMMRNFGESYQIEELTYTYPYMTYIYYGVTILEAIYDISLTYSPTDNPLYTDKQYTFTATSFMNGYGFRCVLTIFIDNTQKISKETATNGVLTFTYRELVSGTHNVTIKMYVNSNEVYDEHWIYQFSQTTEPTSPTTDIMIPNITALVVTYMPIMCVLFVPAFALGYKFGLIGLLIGTSIGISTALLSGLMPTYILLIFVIIVVMGFVYLLRRG